ncbi:hypothetical protein BT96DRAFT_1003698 [Gymnopus androsaceus JB14]|uniref:Uncharacterized protein n=1 Tax=Gymnopus androsaceus JB14 TaxID=1447944 RepID=A0A6A4GU87_9AGAR|nr:hypothetical protein BT96DRAFT_1003698 [Gymnopus androsaceus JB14]
MFLEQTGNEILSLVVFDENLKNSEFAAKGFIPQELVANEGNWFYKNLGIDDTYFSDNSQAVICDRYLAPKMLAYTKHDPSKLVIDLEKIEENGNGATFIHTSPPGITTTEGPGATCESRIDTLFLDNSKPKQTRDFCATGSISATASHPAIKDTEGRTVSDKSFLEKANEKRYERASFAPSFSNSRSCGALSNGTVPSWRFSKSKAREVIGYKMGGTTTLFSALSNLYHFYSLYSARKYVEQFSNGITIISLYLNAVPNSNAPPIEHSIFQVMKEASLLFCLPETPFFLPKAPGTHAVQEAMYAYCGWIFAQHFCNRLDLAYLQLKNVLDENDPAHAEVLNNIKRRFREETFTRAFQSTRKSN